MPENGVTGDGGGFPAGAKRFNAAYLASFRDYIREPCELTLRNVYELGREAVEEGLSVLDLAVAHHDARHRHARARRDGAAGAGRRVAGQRPQA